ncbi:MAG: DUF6335 family protein [Leptolyngbyaceae cyanobacterium MO_188.B28]|nr:DUF6335 family protein [Leptolyngbyaceae cyanobacterium MO_188.B28]
MADSNLSDAVNPSSTPWDAVSQQAAEKEELLLADVVGNENVDPIFEGVVDRDTGMGRTLNKLKNPRIGADVTGGDLDDNWYQAEVVGEEAVGGQTPTPDQNVTEDLIHSMGLSAVDGHPVRTLVNLEQRDNQRWELDPESAEDYPEHAE